jgi:hypothetical protein
MGMGEDIMSINLNNSIETEESKNDFQQKTENSDNRSENLTKIIMALSLLIMLFIMIVFVITT